MKLSTVAAITLALFLTGCANPDGSYPIWQPSALTVGVTDPTLFRDGSDGHKIGHFGNIGGTVTLTFPLHPTVTVHPPNTPTLVKSVGEPTSASSKKE